MFSDSELGKPLLEIKKLRIEFPTRKGVLVAVDDISLNINKGEILGIVGESGAGKSLTGNAIIGLLDPPGHLASGKILFDGQRIDSLSYEEMRRIRGHHIGAIFQDPLTSLNPLYRIKDQISRTIQTHEGVTKEKAAQRALELLKEVGIPAARDRINHYPHQFSGGMRQRIVLALALCCNPSLVIADEPTTALDVSVQCQIIALIKRLSIEHRTAFMLITHDMGVIAETADRVAVMYAGGVVEVGPVSEIVKNPKHPYTIGLMGAIPVIGQNRENLIQIKGMMPRLTDIPSGCSFHPRCDSALQRCKMQKPKMVQIGMTSVACWLFSGK